MLNLQNTLFELETFRKNCIDKYLECTWYGNLGYYVYTYEVTVPHISLFLLYQYYFYLHENNFNYSFNQIYNMP